jgi:hypothetical protein
MNYIHVKTKDLTVTMSSEKVSRNIFIDLTKGSKKKMEAIESLMSQYDKLDDPLIDILLTKKILTW